MERPTATAPSTPAPACASVATAPASVPDLGGTIELHLDGTFLPYDATMTAGWTWVDTGNGELVLNGDACTLSETLPLEALEVVVNCAR